MESVHRAESSFARYDVRELIEVGIALSAEKDIDRLLETIAATARRLARAEGVSVYIRSADRNRLCFSVMQNSRLELFLAGSEIRGGWPNIDLYLDDNQENHKMVCAHCALTGKAVNIHDVYHESGFDFSGTRDFDRRSDYRSRSMLVVPMLDNEGEVVGVLQLLNNLSESGKVVAFERDVVEVMRSLASQAAVAIANVTLTRDLQKLGEIGTALSAEKNCSNLLAKIAATSREFAGAEGASVYILDDAKERLSFAVVQNEKFSFDILADMQGKAWPGISLYHKDGSENHTNVSAHCALTGRTINIPDVYNEEGFDFEGTRAIDKRLGYRSKSMLLIPLRDHEDEIIGVLQLLNAKSGSGEKGRVFRPSEVERATGLASQAAVAITNARLIEQTEKLLKSFVRSIALAIDEKSPYTAGHISRVVQLTESIAQAVNRASFPPFAEVVFDENNLEEIRLAAWLHDIGKIATPQFIVDKATKLETIVDRIELIRLRVELLKRDLEKAKGLDAVRQEGSGEHHQQPYLSTMQEALLENADDFIKEINVGSEFMKDEAISKLNQIAEMRVMIGGENVPLLDKDEVACCSIRKGTLTEYEREIINRHIVTTISMLDSLPFPKKWKNVPEYAGMHHEKLDGSGYPAGVSGDEISLPARIIAIADIFEALTAADRPYKQGKKMSESVKILANMVKDHHLDQDVCNLLFECGIAMEYARKFLPAKQLDTFSWRGREYAP